MMITGKHLSRRTLLRGLGVSLALPMLALYEGAVIAVRIVEKRRAAAEKAKAAGSKSSGPSST